MMLPKWSMILMVSILIFHANTGCSSGSQHDEGNEDATTGEGSGREISGEEISDGGSSQSEWTCPICGTMQLVVSVSLPNLLLVVDRSSSMGGPISSGSTQTKTDDAKEALDSMVDQGEGKIRFGWMQFPMDDCVPGIVEVGCGDTSAPEIRKKIKNLRPTGQTPTGDSLQNANSYDGLHDATRHSFVVLLTDGMPHCPGKDDQASNGNALEGVRNLKKSGVDTFVVGMGTDLYEVNPELLNQMAEAGGRPRSGDTKYYQVNTLQELKDAFDQIGASIVKCSFSLEPIPEYPRYLWVNFDKQLIPRDPQQLNGWLYDESLNQISFFGEACQRLRTGQVQLVEILMGCSPPT